MARIRTIKPEFWTDGEIVRMSPWARLLFIGSWNFTLCDHGHLDDDPFRLKMQIFPADNVDIDALLEELISAGRVTRLWDTDGRSYLHIRRFEDHQKIDPRWKTRCPACNSPELTETHVSLGEPQRVDGEAHRDSPKLTATHPRKGWEGMGRDGMGEDTRSPAAPSSPRVTRFDEFWAIYPRKVGKDKARTAYTTATKRTDEDTIIAGATRLAQDPNLPEKTFIPHPTTWLTRGGWDDEPLPSRRSSQNIDSKVGGHVALARRLFDEEQQQALLGIEQ